MKNIHVIPTSQPSNITIQKRTDKLCYDVEPFTHDKYDVISNQHIYITSNEEIKDGDWIKWGEAIYKANKKYMPPFKKIILTTDQDLIKEGVQAIDDEFLEWFVNNPSCEEVEVDRIELNTDYRSDWKQKFRHKIIIPKEKQKQHLIDMMKGDEELGLYDDSTRYAHNNFNMYETNNYQALKQGYEAGAIEMAERMYSEEDLMKAWHNGMKSDNGFFGSFKQWFEQFKKK